MLLIVNDFNTRSQPGRTSMENVAALLQQCLDRLEDFCLRIRNADNGQRRSKANEFIWNFHANKHKRTPPANATELEKMLAKLEVQVRKESGTGSVTRVARLSVKWKLGGEEQAQCLYNGSNEPETY